MDISNSKPENTKEDAQAAILHEMIEMVTRQTEYDYDTAKAKLEQNEWNYTTVIREYMGVTEKKPIKKTLNQEIFKQIRNHMDIASSNYYRN
tara:strand:- start:551 stop:826 length:276 start_codon:yes stop_codon:yes gene_type:complete